MLRAIPALPPQLKKIVGFTNSEFNIIFNLVLKQIVHHISFLMKYTVVYTDEEMTKTTR